MDNAGLGAADIDGIIVATTTPDLTFPSVATMVQRALGVPAGSMAMDVQAVCAGFIYAMGTADALLRAGRMRRALVIGAETMSRILDWEDRSTCVLFGDGAGAVILEADDSLSVDERGIIDLQMNADGALIDMLHTTGGPSSTQTVGLLQMAGKEVFRHAVEKMSGAVLTLLDRHGFSPDDVKWYIPHQANQRILAAVAARKSARLPERFISTVASARQHLRRVRPARPAPPGADGRAQARRHGGHGRVWAAALAWGATLGALVAINALIPSRIPIKAVQLSLDSLPSSKRKTASYTSRKLEKADRRSDRAKGVGNEIRDLKDNVLEMHDFL